MLLNPRRLALLLLPLALAALAAWLLISRGASTPSLGERIAAQRAALGRCLQERARHADRVQDGGERECPGAPESPEDLAKLNDSVTARLGSSDSRLALSRALRQRDRLAAHAAQANVPGTGGAATSNWNQAI